MRWHVSMIWRIISWNINRLKWNVLIECKVSLKWDEQLTMTLWDEIYWRERFKCGKNYWKYFPYGLYKLICHSLNTSMVCENICSIILQYNCCSTDDQWCQFLVTIFTSLMNFCCPVVSESGNVVCSSATLMCLQLGEMESNSLVMLKCYTY